ncbi:ABC-1 domain protein [Gluconacetobacter diazotrophicus PA1 5]|uniref:AarF/ABC1/UbiB kinase family protein n=2 Tax=Gluconacetobacter diazotrophicus TaxID=33996 RepID=A0A7W4FC14_GLUDI|nr:AarF/ABC1/UbiB kinase family protein [Gluconacetobacter diazotrophicus]ACI50124.1 ABC-1 domain protein [Gluconacetobacter diazotrophicus PA1 5]MBB2154956.1 AarF/ABC1/UbiB kinase family protein [Gluconacetobacter diazotrophicus]TWB08117.1 putative unusual protein kinase regulating ubiquinone biosynthesis (AarF/ABC1/UbiB family) [Gluconacetobacter diazotrophicus]CAP56052.1 putative ubiquinone biosynthesis protein ubiB [Gluconacetobacter diazotrophicus PA1 5]
MAEERDLDNTGLFGEFRRMVRTSGAVGGIAARIAGHKMGIRTDRTAHAGDLKSILGGLKGPLMKGAQLLSTIPGALPEEYAVELAQLQANAPAMGWSFVRRRMASELGRDWERRFRTFEHEAAAAASLGQVHRAVLPDGRLVACKLQYPDMQATVDSDLRQFRMAVGLYYRIDSTIQQDDVLVELEARLREELDYLREAANLRLYRLMLADRPDVSVPAPVEDMTTRRLLVMDWLEGRGVQKVLDTNPSQDQRNAMARALFHAWYVPLYRYGVIHGDPHMGNFTVRGDYGLNLLDLGAIRIFPARFVQGIIDLYRALERNDEDLAYHAYQAWGFTNMSRETMRILNEWARFIYEPLMQDRVRPIQENDDPQFGRAVAERVYAGLKRTGGVRPPREFVLVDRSAIGLGSVFLRLGAKLNWYRLFQELIADFDAAQLAARQAEAIRVAGVPTPIEA